MVVFNPPANSFANSNFREPLPDVPVLKSCTRGVLVSSSYIDISFTFLVMVGVMEGITYSYSVAIPYTKPYSCN